MIWEEKEEHAYLFFCWSFFLFYTSPTLHTSYARGCALRFNASILFPFFPYDARCMSIGSVVVRCFPCMLFVSFFFFFFFSSFFLREAHLCTFTIRFFFFRFCLWNITNNYISPPLFFFFYLQVFLSVESSQTLSCRPGPIHLWEFSTIQYFRGSMTGSVPFLLNPTYGRKIRTGGGGGGGVAVFCSSTELEALDFY